MSFNYSKNRENQSQDSFWTSYSDLFLGLSTIFLLLYVTASLRTGTEGLRSQIESEKLSMRVEELQQQLRMYESVKNDYMQNQATKNEMNEYEELMDKLTLLQEDTKSEKERLLQEAYESENKMKALNKYQQMVRNVLNANKMAKSKIVNRDDLIKEQDVEIQGQEFTIAELNKDIADKKQRIAQGQAQIQQAQQQLAKKSKDLQAAFKANKLTKAAYEQRMAQAKAESQATVSKLNQANAQYQEQLQSANQQLGQVQDELSKTQGLLSHKEEEARYLAGSLAKNKVESQQKMAAMSAGFAAEKEGLQAGFAKEKAGLEAGHAAEKQAGAAKVAALQAGLEAERALGAAKVADLRGKLNTTQSELAKAKAEIEARKSVANEIQKGFAKAGVKADINQSGDVVLDFGQAYFDSDSDRLKLEMKSVLEKAMPIYSKSLFGNPKLSGKISAVEVIGFASPTYQGRFIDPSSNRPEDKVALKYNMDLSYRRANSIFSYLIDQSDVRQFAHQKELLSLMKVSGRSFLEVMQVQNRNVATATEFCRQNDCKKAQRVIIRFSMDQNK